MKLGRNSLCWCGSGKKYKHCHYGRADELPVPPGQFIHNVSKHFNYKDCLHPQASKQTCSKIINAHTIQRSGALTSIVDSRNHVQTFYPPKRDESSQFILQTVGYNKASTFTGFCGKHDNEVFSPLEKSKFDGNAEQCFLIGYRAICHELYQKRALIKSEPHFRQLDRGRPYQDQKAIKEIQDLNFNVVNQAMDFITKLKDRADRILLNGQFDEWSKCIIRFKGDLSIVSTGVPNPDIDTSGKELMSIMTLYQTPQGLPYGIVPIEGGGAIVFSYPAEFDIMNQFLLRLITENREIIPSLLVEFIFIYVENTYFSDAWWNQLSDSQKERIKYLVNISRPYDGGWDGYSRRPLVNWNITSIEKQ